MMVYAQAASQPTEAAVLHRAWDTACEMEQEIISGRIEITAFRIYHKY